MNAVNILDVRYATTGNSRKTNALGMLEMQARAYEHREDQYLLLKSPPASGKSRALMFLALHKIQSLAVKKVIVAVPETGIGRSFRSTKLTEHGFFEDWCVEPRYNLCSVGGDAGKVKSFVQFIDDPRGKILICTHSALRAAYEQLSPSDFDDILLGIDEFHHSSASEESRLGRIMDELIDGSNAHIIAMTGSYFRGDAVPIMLPEYEAMFTQVTYSYYEQLNGYQYLKSLGMNYHFYQGDYLSSIDQVLDTSLKTIIHIPHVNSLESTKDKLDEVGRIVDVIGNVVGGADPTTGILTIRDKKGRLLKVADLVTDTVSRAPTQAYLDQIENRDDLDIIIALGMAKEGFDWVWCEHVLTVGYRASLTEVVQIIGRATRDAKGKTHAQFTNLIVQPDAEDEDVNRSVNNLLKAISVSLLMQQVLTPNVNFKPRSRSTHVDNGDLNTITFDDSTAPLSDRGMQILNDQDNITARLLNNSREVIAPLATGQSDTNTLISYDLPKIILEMYPDVSLDELDLLAQKIHASLVYSNSGGFIDESDLPANAKFHDVSAERTAQNQKDADKPRKPSVEFNDSYPSTAGDSRDVNDAGTTPDKIRKKFALIDNKFIDVNDLDLPMIQDIVRSTNPFKESYTVVSRNLDVDTLRAIDRYVATKRSVMSDTEAVHLYPNIKEFMSQYGRKPLLNHSDHYENRLALALNLIVEHQRNRLQNQNQSNHQDH